MALQVDQKPNLLRQALLKAGSCSGLIGVFTLGGLGLTGQAHAFGFEDFKQVSSAVSAIKQADNLTAGWEVNRAQTAQTPKDIGDRNMEVEANVLAIKDGVAEGERITQALEDFKPGVGIPNSLSCEAVQEEKDHVRKQELSNRVSLAISESHAAKFYRAQGTKRALRAKDHYQNYCDITEVAQGICLPSPNARSGMNLDYSNIYGNKTMEEEQINAGYSFVRNIIDPAKTDDSFCKNVTCKALGDNERQYATLGSMIQYAFLSQIQDGIPYEAPPGGAPTVVVEQLGEVSPDYQGPYRLWDETAVQGGPPGDGSLVNPDGDVPYSDDAIPGKLTKQMAEAIAKVARNIGVKPNDLAAVIAFESGFSTSMKNKRSGATGLIQFMPKTARWLGISTAALAAMSFDQQMVWVEKYFKKKGFSANKPQPLGKVYTAVTGCRNRPKGVCYSKYANEEAYKLNKVWDANGDGYIMDGEQVQSKRFASVRKDYMGAFGLPNE